MHPADSALGIFRNPDPNLCVPGHRILRPSPRALNLSQVVASVFHFRIVNTPPASISIHFRKSSARQLSEIMIVKRVYSLYYQEKKICL